MDLSPRENRPPKVLCTLLTEIHQSLHIGPKAFYHFLSPLFYHPHLCRAIETVHHACKTCSSVNSQGGIPQPGPNHQLRGHQPGEDWQLDFTHMPYQKAFQYILTLVDTFTGWIEAFPTTERLLTLLPKYLLNTSFADSASLEPYSQIPGRLSQPASLRSPKVSASPRNCMYPTIPSPRVR